MEESLSDLRIEAEHTATLTGKESKTGKLEIDRLKAFDAKVESDVFVLRTVISDMNTSTNAMKNSSLEVSKAIAILKTENEINKMEKDFNLLKITTVQNELEESKIVINHLRSTNNISKIEQLDRVTNLEYEISKMKSRQPAVQFDDLDETLRSVPPTEEQNRVSAKFSHIEKEMLALTGDVSFLGGRVDRLEPLEQKVQTSHDITSHHITQHHITQHHITQHHITQHHITQYHITQHHITQHHITQHHITYNLFEFMLLHRICIHDIKTRKFII